MLSNKSFFLFLSIIIVVFSSQCIPGNTIGKVLEVDTESIQHTCDDSYHCQFSCPCGANLHFNLDTNDKDMRKLNEIVCLGKGNSNQIDKDSRSNLIKKSMVNFEKIVTAAFKATIKSDPDTKGTISDVKKKKRRFLFIKLKTKKNLL